MRDYSQPMDFDGTIGGMELGEVENPLTVISLTPAGAAMAAADYRHGRDATTATVWRNHHAARVMQAGRP